ncbi:hypothetical protein [Phenylobacterium sp.]|uniref:hypothetical protein n=1 Tax=Phenylobacterium sp. TaxID=1871053 RepID=UPI002C3DBECC|nr:hypothetical protein [Phenylobacterium sp.]HVI32509.1 hypothetical protein [Phenylobacterium sp.]
MKPDDLRQEAEAAEHLATVVSYAPDKARLTARAAELRRQADALEARPPGAGGPAGVRDADASA